MRVPMTPLRHTMWWFAISLNSDVPSGFHVKTFTLQRYNRLHVKLESQGSSAKGNRQLGAVVTHYYTVMDS
jgi:hypothetical protein